MFAFLKRAFIPLIGLLLIALFIYIAGPFFAFADYRPLESVTARLLAISLVIACWVVSALLKRWRAKRASDQLAAAVVRQSRQEQEKEKPSAEATKLRERFEEAVSALQRGRAGKSLYDLPWYVFIGAPGSGKTTALLNSGLKFPLEQRAGRAEVRGVGGTRNCDWCFTDEAVFLDTAGRYTTQDSDPTSDSEGFKEFLALLGKYRKRRPVNGVVLTISAQDLMTLGESGREAHIEAARHRLTEFTRELRIQLPVYVMVTKCDVVAGFAEYFDDLPKEGRAEVWGVTFPYEQTLAGEAPRALPAEFDALMARLNARLFARLEGESGARRRAAIFGFPQQMAALREPLTQFVADVFSSTRFDRKILLRGVYLTSGTQDGTQIDRLLGAIGRRFGLAPASVQPPAGRGKAFFVERLLKDVVIAESGLAGVNRRLELQKAAWQLGAYAAIVLFVAVSLVAMWVSHARNGTYLAEVAKELAALRDEPRPAPNVPVEGLLPRLNAVRAVADSANRYQGDVPWGMRWGLYQGAAVGNFARDAYQRELKSLLLPRLADLFKQHLVDYRADPEKIFNTLKGYLMLGDPRRLDKKHLQQLADLEWKAPDGIRGAGDPLSAHVRSLLDIGEALPPTALDQSVVAKARSALQQTSIPQIIFGQLQRKYDDPSRGLPLDVRALNLEKVFRLKSGGALSKPFPALYTKAVFNETTGLGMVTLTKQFADDAWVWNPGPLPAAIWLKLQSQVIDLYETNYKNAWDDFLGDLDIVQFPTVKEWGDALGLLGGQFSPLRGILRVVVENTSFVAPPAPNTAPSVVEKFQQTVRDKTGLGKGSVPGTPGETPGTAITNHFQPIHLFMAGAPAPIEPILEEIRQIQSQLLQVGPQAARESSLAALTDPKLRDLLRNLQLDAANLPEPVKTWISRIVQNVGAAVGADATAELERVYRAQVVTQCQTLVAGHYPFDNSGPDISLKDFKNLFGDGGVYADFFEKNLVQLVDTSNGAWAWRPDSVHASSELLRKFQEAARIRQMFFGKGSSDAQLEFTVTLSNLDAAATYFRVTIDGKGVQVGPGARVQETFLLPLRPDGSVLVHFADTHQAPLPAFPMSGPWALFKLIEKGSERRDVALGTAFGLANQYHHAQVTIETSHSANPFHASEWRGFTCGS